MGCGFGLDVAGREKRGLSPGMGMLKSRVQSRKQSRKVREDYNTSLKPRTQQMEPCAFLDMEKRHTIVKKRAMDIPLPSAGSWGDCSVCAAFSSWRDTHRGWGAEVLRSGQATLSPNFF